MRKEFRNRLAKLVAKKLLSWLVARSAFFSFGPIGFIASFIVERVIDKALELTFLGAMVAYINLKAESDLNEIEKILRDISQSEDGLSQDDMESFDARLAKAGRNLIRFSTIR